MSEPVIIEIDGIIFPSLKAASLAFDVNVSTVSRHLNAGTLDKLSRIKGYIGENSFDIDPAQRHKLQAEITFGLWDYRLTISQIVNVGPGWEYWFDQAINLIFLNLPGTGMAEITLTNRTGDTLLCQDQDFAYEEWLKAMVISARLVNK